MRYLAAIVRACIEAPIVILFALFVALCAVIAGIGAVYRWSVTATETPEERAAREHEEWKLRTGGTSL